jgi:5-methyltetrahydrofolate--homocysteine methyltransferase
VNAEAAMHAVQDVGGALGMPIPLMISGTVARAPGQMLSGQSPDAFWRALSHGHPMTVGLNCGFGARALRPHLRALAGVAPVAISVHPNAGLPNAFGGYDDTPGAMAAVLRSFAEEGLINLVGGCCGTTPAFVAALAEAVRGLSPRKIPSPLHHA